MAAVKGTATVANSGISPASLTTVNESVTGPTSGGPSAFLGTILYSPRYSGPEGMSTST